jgi:hypothetical protein
MHKLAQNMKNILVYNKNINLIIIGFITSLGITFYWNDITNIIVDLFGMTEKVKIADRQTIKKALFFANTIGLMFVTLKIFESKSSNLIFKILIVIILIIWFIILMAHTVAFGLVS